VSTYRLVRIAGDTRRHTHIATFPRQQPLCTGDRTVQIRGAGKGEPTCPDCRRLTSPPPAA
jgi:hypothetical protein